MTVSIAKHFKLEGFKVSDMDDTSNVQYFGFMNNLSNWYILKFDSSVVPNTFRYIKGTTNYNTNWTNRTALMYGYYDAIF